MLIEGMRGILKIILYLSIAAVVISIAAICFTIFKTKPIDISNSTAIEWTVSALSLLVVILVAGFGINYFTFERKVNKMISDKYNETKGLVKDLLNKHDKKMTVYLEERISHRISYNNYRNFSFIAKEYHRKGNYTQSFIKALEASSIFPNYHKGVVEIELDEPSGMIMDFFNDAITYGKVLYAQVKEKGYNDFDCYDVEKIAYLLKRIYSARNENVPTFFDKVIDLMKSKIEDRSE